jgi:hypothetical protein
MNYRYNSYKEIYYDYLPIYFGCTTLLGSLLGSASVMSIMSRESVYAIDCFTMIIGYSGIGMIIGITYPISYPLIGCYILHKNK